MADAQFSLVSASDETRDFPLFLSFSLPIDGREKTSNEFRKRKKQKKKKTDIKKYYSTDGARKIGCARRDKDLPRGKQKGERSDMYDGS